MMENGELFDQPQVIELTGEDSAVGKLVTSSSVKVVSSAKTSLDGNSELTCASSFVKNVTIANQQWDQSFYTGKLVASSDRYFAYAVRGKNGYMVRVINQRTTARTLLKGLLAPVSDLSFAHDSSNLLACLDTGGNLFIWELSDSGGDIICEVYLIVHSGREADPNAVNRLAWSPHMAMSGKTEDDDEDPRVFLAISFGSTAEVYDVDVAHSAQIGDTPVARETLLHGVVVIPNAHTQNIFDVSLSPDAAVLATCGGDGHVKFWQVDQAAVSSEPHGLHDWEPHDGAVVSSVLFLDDLVHHDPQNTLWRFVVTGAERNRVLKVWCTITWACLQTISFEPEVNDDASSSIFGASVPSLQLTIDPSASYLILSDITRKVLYILHMAQDAQAGRARVGAVTEYVISQPVLSFSVIGVEPYVGSPATNRAFTNGREPDQHLLRLCCLQPKVIQELCVHLFSQWRCSLESGGAATDEVGSSMSTQRTSETGGSLAGSLLDSSDSPLDVSSLTTPSSLLANEAGYVADSSRLGACTASPGATSPIHSTVLGSGGSFLGGDVEDQLLTPAAFAAATTTTSSSSSSGTEETSGGGGTTSTSSTADSQQPLPRPSSPLLSSSLLLQGRHASPVDGGSLLGMTSPSSAAAIGLTSSRSSPPLPVSAVSPPLSGSSRSLSLSATSPLLTSGSSAILQSSAFLQGMPMVAAAAPTAGLPIRPLNPHVLGGLRSMSGVGGASVLSSSPSPSLLGSMSIPFASSTEVASLAGGLLAGSTAASTLDSGSLHPNLATSAGRGTGSTAGTVSEPELSGEDVIVVEEEDVDSSDSDSDGNARGGADGDSGTAESTGPASTTSTTAATTTASTSNSAAAAAGEDSGASLYDLNMELDKVLRQTHAATMDFAVAHGTVPVTGIAPLAPVLALGAPDPGLLPVPLGVGRPLLNPDQNLELGALRQESADSACSEASVGGQYDDSSTAVMLASPHVADSGNDDTSHPQTPNQRRRRARNRRKQHGGVAGGDGGVATAPQDVSDGDCNVQAEVRTKSPVQVDPALQSQLVALVQQQQLAIVSLQKQLQQQEELNARQFAIVQRLDNTMSTRAREEEAHWSNLNKDRHSEKQRQNSSASQLPGTLASAVQQKVEKSLKHEIKSIVPVMERQMASIPQQMRESIASSDSGFVESLSRAMKSKAVTEALGSSVAGEVVPHATQAVRGAFESSLVPGVQQAVNSMLTQVNGSLQMCSHDYVQQVQAVVQQALRSHEAAAAKTADGAAALADKCESFAGQQARVVTGALAALPQQIATGLQQTIGDELAKSLAGVREALVAQVKQELAGLLQAQANSSQHSSQQLMAGLLSQHTAALTQQVAARLQQQEAQQLQMSTAVQQSVGELTQLIKSIQVQMPPSATSSSEGDGASGPQQQQLQSSEANLQQLIAQGLYQQAFMEALSASNIARVIYLCRLVPTETLFPATSPCPLSQQILLSLVQQLSCDLAADLDLKVCYLSSAMSVLDSTHPITSKYGPAIMQRLAASIDAVAPSHPELHTQFHLLKTVSRSIK